VEGAEAVAVVVEALAMPRKRVSVAGRGRPRGRRKGSDIEGRVESDPVRGVRESAMRLLYARGCSESEVASRAR
jgi:hypothetical protein